MPLATKTTNKNKNFKFIHTYPILRADGFKVRFNFVDFAMEKHMRVKHPVSWTPYIPYKMGTTS